MENMTEVADVDSVEVAGAPPSAPPLAPPQFTCSTCGQVFKHQSTHSRHQSQCGQEKSFACNQCDKKFSRKDALKRHLKTCKPREVSFQCRTCPKTFPKNWMFVRHEKTCSVKSPVEKSNKRQCCNKSFTPSGLNSHRARCHPKAPRHPNVHGVFEGDVFHGEVPEPIDDDDDGGNDMPVEMELFDEMLVMDINDEDGIYTAVVGNGASTYEPDFTMETVELNDISEDESEDEQIVPGTSLTSICR